MSQPCSMLDLVLFDARSLADPGVQEALRTTASRGVHRGAIADRPDIVEMVNQAGCAGQLDFWLGETPGTWPFERALALVSAEPGRALFVSTDETAREAARRHGLHVVTGRLDDVEQMLP